MWHFLMRLLVAIYVPLFKFFHRVHEFYLKSASIPNLIDIMRSLC